MLGIDTQDVTRRLGDDLLRADRFPETRDVVLQRGGGGLRGIGPPDLVDQTIARERLVRVQQEEREQRAHALAVERNVPTVLDDRKRAENAKFDRDDAFLAPLAPKE